MKFTVLTNFDNYESSLNCDSYGVITLILKPAYIKDISLYNNFFNKKGKTIFKKVYCTLYKKNKNSFLYKFTNHYPQFNNYESQKLDIFNFNIPTCSYKKYVGIFSFLINSYYHYKTKKSVKMYNKYYLHKFY